MSRYILKIDCPERMGIVRAVSNFLYEIDCTVVEAAEYADLENQRFFARWEFSRSADAQDMGLEQIRERFKPLAEFFAMRWELYDAAVKPRVLIAVSQHGHCLNDLLFRWKEEESFPAEIVGAVSNHEVFRDKVQWHGLPFHYLPVNPRNKPEQEQRMLGIMQESRAELLVLARYMQILSDDLCRSLQGRAINIHHSFLPSFKGAKPYHQAHARGVKISGATAHYVTGDLDEGPIIEQDVQRHEHNHDSAKMARMGKNIETLVLARAVYWHCQRRIILDGSRTVIFK
ncbi:MAG TPA: formyltetrahydrofolate deformylase [Burkholderiaceae bacterium]|mgnify:FL=1|nr:formyltetrahydrofolate deformylase [Burkholderiaceae bacterium]